MQALPLPLVLGASFAYLALLFAIAWWADRRAAQGRSVIGNAWVYSLSIGVYCTAWTYFGSVGRAATSGLWFLPIYLGPTLAMLLAWTLLRKMVRIAHTNRITSIADFVASRYGKSRALAALVTLIALVGILPYVALQLKAIASGFTLLTGTHGAAGAPWWQDSTFVIALLLAGFTIAFGTRHLDASERHEGMVAAIALESVVKLLAFIAVGVFVTWRLFDGPADLFARAAAEPALAPLLGLTGSSAGDARFAGGQWFALTLLAALSLLFLPRQFQVMVVELVDERHLKRATWAFPLYLLLINLFVLPIALGGLLHFGRGMANPETFVLSLPLAAGHSWLALVAFVGGLSAATGMVIVEAIAVSTMVCNDLVMPLVLRSRPQRDLSRLPLHVRRAVIVLLLLLGYLYFRIAGEAYALVSIGLISFAAVAQFAPALIGGMYWKGATRAGALAGLVAGFALWAWTLLLPSVAKSGWLAQGFVADGPFGLTLLRPEQLFGLAGLDNLTHALLWSLVANIGLFVAVSLARAPSAREMQQALRFVDVFRHDRQTGNTVRWRAQAPLAELRQLAARFLGAEPAERLFAAYAQKTGAHRIERIAPDAQLVRHVETQLAGAIGSASAHAVVATVVEEEPLGPAELLRLLDEASQVRALNRQLEGLDKLKDDFISSVTHELRTPLTSIRAFAELMRDDPDMPAAQRQEFIGLVVAETERLSRLVNQVLDMAKMEAGHGQWRREAIDLPELIAHTVQTTSELFRERGVVVTVQQPEQQVPPLMADRDRLLQVLINLLSNAAKFVPKGGGRVTVTLATNAQGATIEVQDNGPGVPVEQQQLIFEKFRQGGDTANRPQGTGLGLPISRKIVEHFGGRMWLKSMPGQGACFGFELPWQHDEETM
jgi:Na+/proline symporter/nitrogen-specific signal transduction histidine kinase